jgi:hypothetical protein
MNGYIVELYNSSFVVQSIVGGLTEEQAKTAANAWVAKGGGNVAKVHFAWWFH